MAGQIAKKKAKKTKGPFGTGWLQDAIDKIKGNKKKTAEQLGIDPEMPKKPKKQGAVMDRKKKNGKA
jgi:hypothetical protein